MRKESSEGIPFSEAEGRTHIEQVPAMSPGFLAKLGEDGVAEEPVFYLEILGPKGRIQRCRLRPGENLLGRAAGARIQPETPDISRRHAVLTVDGAEVRVRDEGSRNHTFVEGEKIQGEVKVELGVLLRFGSTEARLMVLEED